jgi:acyl carrier protein
MATREEVFTEVQAVLSEVFEIEKEQISPEKNLFTDFDLDSLDAIDMAAELGNRTDTTFSNENLRNIRTVDDVVIAILGIQSDNG